MLVSRVIAGGAERKERRDPVGIGFNFTRDAAASLFLHFFSLQLLAAVAVIN